MPLSSAAFSSHIEAFVGAAAITSAFPSIVHQEVNVLLFKGAFPLLSIVVDRGGGSSKEASDDDLPYAAEFTLVAAAKLGSTDKQHEVIGQLAKVIRDTAGTIQLDGVSFEVDDFSADGKADLKDGSRVWAAMAVKVDYQRPRGNY